MGGAVTLPSIFINMILLKKNNTLDNIIVTLTESVTLSNPIYKFTFTNVTTQQSLTFTKLVADDLSSFPLRFNKFAINTSVLFANLPAGEYMYVICEQDDLIAPTVTNELENGKMTLFEDVAAMTAYTTDITMKQYEG